jgi:hypothetical protein
MGLTCLSRDGISRGTGGSTSVDTYPCLMSNPACFRKSRRECQGWDRRRIAQSRPSCLRRGRQEPMGFLLYPTQYARWMLSPDRHLSITPHLVLEHGSAKHRQMALDHLVTGLLEFATNEQGSKSVTKALKEGGKETLDRFVKRMAESTKGYGDAFYSQNVAGHTCAHTSISQWPQSHHR